MQNKDRRVIKKSDFIILGVVICVTAICFTLFKQPSDKALAEIRLNGMSVLKLPLNTDTSVNLDTLNADFPNIKLVVSDGYIYIEEADCYDKVCVHTGKINSKYQSIVCLPNKLIVNILDYNTYSNIDVVM